jgi:hypothetical protein
VKRVRQANITFAAARGLKEIEVDAKIEPIKSINVSCVRKTRRLKSRRHSAMLSRADFQYSFSPTIL